jgi:hypothetical protein
MRDERHADHAARDLPGLLGLGGFTPPPLAAAAEMDLRLRRRRGAEAPGDLRRSGALTPPAGTGAVARENRFRLILEFSYGAATAPAWKSRDGAASLRKP